jgi:tRNA (cytidine/uridine-2'-O-)-methyltransferase
MNLRLVLFQPDIAQNTGTLLRLAACLDVPVDIIEPCGFHMDDRRLRRAALDYLDALELTRHISWQAYREGLSRAGRGRLVLLTTRGELPYSEFAFQPDDSLMVGRESAGVPEAVHQAAHARLRIPMRPSLRSINVALAAAMVLGEALRQTGQQSRVRPR